MVDFGDSLRAGEYFKDFWMQISALPDGSRVERRALELDGEIGIVMSKGIAIRFKNEKKQWTIRMTSDPKAGFGMRIIGTDDGRYVGYQMDKNGVRGGEVI